MAIAEYRNTMVGRAVNLNATLLFKNSNTIAGDTLVKRVIERVLLPELAAPRRTSEERTFRSSFAIRARSGWLVSQLFSTKWRG